ncbi:hypothetical protein H7K45_30035 [Mycobacterium yunnanensis]|uniref:Uncharacterized protein n=1 Tax=Mycobacterium yunnanensis TaxID=368477 RepID=A0A9X2ZDD2_9MYCO|nr:hypothetical protein [Mycobacterium yunnanensis]MCV7424787.1 hypothetical protein [Mycobacterium yunnanensis]
MQQLPPLGVLGDLPARDFVVSPGFAGVAALAAAIVTAGAVLYASRRARQRSEVQRVEDERRHDRARGDAEKALLWERWQWVVDTAGIEPAVSENATLGLGPAVALELLSGLLRDAERLGDDSLARAVAVHQEQLLLVLAQQAGPVSDVATPTRQPRRRRIADVATADEGSADDLTEPKTAAFATPSTEVKESSGGRRRR